MSSISKPDFGIVRLNIEKALRLLYKNDLFLITNCTEERAITHKLAEYILKFKRGCYSNIWGRVIGMKSIIIGMCETRKAYPFVLPFLPPFIKRRG